MTEYKRLLLFYNKRSAVNLCQKHSTHDSVFFIVKEEFGYKIFKFYLDSEDYRVGSINETLSDAYNEAVHIL
jgi:hypothetical protein